MDKKCLEVRVQEGVVWITFNARSKKSATLNLNAIANMSGLGPITSQAIEDWCMDRRLDHARGEVPLA